MTATTLARPQHVYPRPQLVHDHRALFVEAVYDDAQPYALDENDAEDDGGE